MLNIIRIKNATFYAYHGVMTEEQSIGGKFEADVDLYTDFHEATEHDNLKETVDYGKVYKYISTLALEGKFKLIETLAVRIADGILINFPNVKKAAVRIRKHNAPLGGFVDYVEVEVIKEQSDGKNRQNQS
ncbi:MAG: dihydroneopterin aldolase [Ignavibacteria bacterium]